MDVRNISHISYLITLCPILWRLLALALLLVLRPLRVLRLVLPRPLRLVLPRPLRLLGAGRGARPSHRESDMATVTLTSLLLRTRGFTVTEPGTDWCTVAASSRHPTLDTPPVSRVTRQHYTHTHTPHR